MHGVGETPCRDRSDSSRSTADIMRGSEATTESPTPFPLVYSLVVLWQLAEGMFDAAILRTLENAICQQHYASAIENLVPVPESKCKNTEIQTRLAYIRALYNVFKTIPGMSSPCYQRLGSSKSRASHLIRRKFWTSCRQSRPPTCIRTRSHRPVRLPGVDLLRR